MFVIPIKRLKSIIPIGIVSIFPQIADIKRLRENLEWSQKKLAEEIGISQSAIAKYETEQQVPSYSIAKRIFEILLDNLKSEDLEVSQVMRKEVLMIDAEDKFVKALDLMKEYGISQIPVISDSKIVGTITDNLSLDFLERVQTMIDIKDSNVRDCMIECLPIVPPNTHVKDIVNLLRRFNAVLVQTDGEIEGIVTKADLLEFE